MQPLLRLTLTVLLLGPCAPPSPPSAPAKGTAAPLQRAYRSGRILKVTVTERAENGSGGPQPATTEGAPPAAESPEGRLVTFTVESGGSVYVARCVEGTAGCRAGDLAAGPVRFRLEGGMLYLERPDGEELAARFVETQR